MRNPLLFLLSAVLLFCACSSPFPHGDLAASPSTICARQSPTNVYCWGQAGVDGTTVASETPTLVPGLSDVAQVSVGAGHACARQSAGTVLCWGDNTTGELGDNGAQRASPTGPVVGMQNAIQIAAGNGFTCALLQGGAVSCWGQNMYGELGDGTTTSRSAPALVIGLPANVVEIAVAGDADHVCARTGAGSVLCWGQALTGGVNGNPQDPTRVTTPFQFPGITAAVQVVVGGGASCVRLASGSVTCWGLPSFDPSGAMQVSSVQGLTDAVEIAVGFEHLCARRASGTVVCVGYNGSAQLGIPVDAMFHGALAPIAGLTDAVELALGGNRSCVRRASGTVECWGDLESATLATPTPTPISIPP